MANNKKSGKTYKPGTKSKKGKSKYTDLERTAFKYGIILSSMNKDCRLVDSFNAGVNVSEQGANRKKKKPLY